MRQIWKFQPANHKPLKMPDGAEMVRFALQAGRPTIWAVVDPTARQVERTFVVVGTGQDMPEGSSYVASWDDGPFVWHLLELPQVTAPTELHFAPEALAAYELLLKDGFTDTRDVVDGRPYLRYWVAPDREPLTTEQMKAVATLQEHGFGPVAE